MELEKICQALLFQNETRRTWTIRLLLRDDYAHSTSEDVRKGPSPRAPSPSSERGTSTQCSFSLHFIHGRRTARWNQ
jgi:hypothetical protein